MRKLKYVGYATSGHIDLAYIYIYVCVCVCVCVYIYAMFIKLLGIVQTKSQQIFRCQILVSLSTVRVCQTTSLVVLYLSYIYKTYVQYP